VSNILINARMALDDRHEGSAVVLGNGPGVSTEGPNRWFSQLDAPGALVDMQRVRVVSAAGAFTACRLTVKRPAERIEGLSRLQLFQPIDPVDLETLAFGVPTGKAGAVGQELKMVFHIRTSVAGEVGVTLNSGAATRNFTTNRPVVAGEWQRIEVTIPADNKAPWEEMGRIGMYFQIGLSCGPTRLTTIDGQWNDGHSLMIESDATSRFITTEGATAEITGCYFGASHRSEDPESPGLNRARAGYFLEKSYASGDRVGTLSFDGSLVIHAQGTTATGTAAFTAIKKRHYLAELYSPSSGAVGMAWDEATGRDVPATIVERSPRALIIAIADATPGRNYRVHWLAHDL
jgi:hypothetical protein